MEKIFIPKGTTEKHRAILTDELIVDGHLIVEGLLQVKRIYGSGTVEAKKIIANTVTADYVDADHICAKKLIANKIFCVTAKVSAGIIAKDYIEAERVKTSRLISVLSEIDTVEASEIIRLSPKRSFMSAIIVSWLKERFTFWRYSRIVKKNNPPAASDSLPKDPTDLEYEALVKSYKGKYLKGGYRLVLVADDTKPKLV